MPDRICQQCGKKLSKGDGRLRCRKCQPVRQTSPSLHTNRRAVTDPKPVVIRHDRPRPEPVEPREVRHCEECDQVISDRNQTGLCHQCQMERPVYNPSLEEIAEACAEIQRDWSPQEERRRRTGYFEEA